MVVTVTPRSRDCHVFKNGSQQSACSCEIYGQYFGSVRSVRHSILVTQVGTREDKATVGAKSGFY